MISSRPSVHQQIFFLFAIWLAFPCKTICQNKDSLDLTFTGANINPYSQEYDTTGKIVFSAYVDTYFSSYSDNNNGEAYVKFPTVSPRNQQFGLNIVQGSARYQSSRFRGTITLFGGDCASAAWSRELNMIQEANLGFHLGGRWWLDAGLFRTHIGLESIQPRENITLSLATTTYFEPYFLSGAKLTCELNSKWTFQINTFNSFNQFIENNRNKAAGFSISHSPSSSLSMTYSSILSDEIQRADEKPLHLRLYNNFCLTLRRPRYILGFEMNGGMQQRSALNDSTHSAIMASSLLAFKYRITGGGLALGFFALSYS